MMKGASGVFSCGPTLGQARDNRALTKSLVNMATSAVPPVEQALDSFEAALGKARESIIGLASRFTAVQWDIGSMLPAAGRCPRKPSNRSEIRRFWHAIQARLKSKACFMTALEMTAENFD
jgi:hypothetical protein